MTTPARKGAKKKKQKFVNISHERSVLNEYFQNFQSARNVYTTLIQEMDEFSAKFEVHNKQFYHCKELMKRLGFSASLVANCTKPSLTLLIQIVREFGDFRRKSNYWLSMLNDRNKINYLYLILLEKLCDGSDETTKQTLNELQQKDENFKNFDPNTCYWKSNTTLLDEWKILKTSLEEKVIQYCQVFEVVCLRFAITNMPALPDNKGTESFLDDGDEDAQFGDVTLPLAKIKLEKKKKPTKNRKPKVEEQHQEQNPS